MNVLYYLEPWVELSNPYFRLGTIKNHLANEFRSLKESGANVAILARDDLLEEAARRGLISRDDVTFLGISLSDIHGMCSSYFDASSRLWSNEVTAVNSLKDIILRAARSYMPDIVVAYETAASDALREIFSDSIVIDSSLGGFSRDPYPETFCYDAGGGLYRSHASKKPVNKADNGADPVVSQIRKHYAQRLSALSPFNLKPISRKFHAVILLPLQVSPYFVFNEGLPDGIRSLSQFDYLVWCLERVPRNIAVVVTEHGAQRLLNSNSIQWLRERYENFIFFADSANYKWASQFMVPEVDGLITVSSSLAVQAALHRKAIHVIGKSHISRLSTHDDMSNFFRDLGGEFTQDANVKELMGRFYVPTADVAWSPNWLFNRFKQLKNDVQFYPTASDRDLLNWYIGGSRHLITADAIKAAQVKIQSPSKRHELTHNQSHRGLECGILDSEINEADVVSFDIFDTLIGRKVDDPSKIWEIAWSKFCRLHPNPAASVAISPTDFIEVRKSSARKALIQAREGGREDVTLEEIYNITAKSIGLDLFCVNSLVEAEIGAEKELTYPRSKGLVAVEKARQLGKKIAYVSDIYINGKYVSDILQYHGVPCPDIFLVSSDRGVLKKTGRLFDLLVSESNVRPEKILHIGDNSVSDIKMARAKGIRALQVPTAGARFTASSAFSAVSWGRCLFSSFVRGAIAEKYFDDWLPSYNRKSLFKGSPRQMGYCAAGPIVVSFALWIARRAIADGVNRICFLARDGRYPYEVYKMLKSKMPDLPEATYVRASRRSCSVAAIDNMSDLISSLSLAFSPVQLNTFLKDRFDFSLRGKKSAVIESGFDSFDQIVTSKNPEDVAKLERLFKIIGEEILEKCRAEGKVYKSYLSSMGLCHTEEKIAIVDIGHNGTLQESLIKITGRDIVGYYFSTFHKATEVAIVNGCQVSGYLLDYVPQHRPNFYSRNIGMFEFLFLPNERSLKRVVCDQNGEFLFEFVEHSERSRLSAAQEISKGVYDFARDAVKAFNSQILDLNPSAYDASAVFRSFIENPTLRDIDIVRGVYFADAFGGSHRRYLIDENVLSRSPRDVESFLLASWWKSGAKAMI